MFKILKYSFYDLMRSRWSYVYFLFYLALGFVLLFLNNNVSKAIITLMNIIIVLTPLIGTYFWRDVLLQFTRIYGVTFSTTP